jgi:hypothetical protein
MDGAPLPTVSSAVRLVMLPAALVTTTLKAAPLSLEPAASE